jgi:hypothetical protein
VARPAVPASRPSVPAVALNPRRPTPRPAMPRRGVRLLSCGRPRAATRPTIVSPCPKRPSSSDRRTGRRRGASLHERSMSPHFGWTHSRRPRLDCTAPSGMAHGRPAGSRAPRLARTARPEVGVFPPRKSGSRRPQDPAGRDTPGAIRGPCVVELHGGSSRGPAPTTLPVRTPSAHTPPAIHHRGSTTWRETSRSGSLPDSSRGRVWCAGDRGPARSRRSFGRGPVSPSSRRHTTGGSEFGAPMIQPPDWLPSPAR